jgi:16S rRNA (uracil1498-N3)-methyltransferase
VEKATELGVATLQPLVCERSVLRVAGDRAERKAAHWQAVAVSACEQSGRNRVPVVAAPMALREWLALIEADAQSERLMLSLDPQAAPWLRRAGAGEATTRPLLVLSGPEGGLSPAEQALALQHRFIATSLGPRVLRADTAPLVALACVAVLEGRP